MITKSDIQRILISSVGALTLSTACVFAAVGPAKAASSAPLTVADWQAAVENKVSSYHEDRNVYQPQTLMRTDVVLHFTADGDFAGATLAKSSGDRLVDRRAVKVARAIRYPAIPAGLRGSPADVQMKLYFGLGPDVEAAYTRERQRASKVQLADAGNNNQIAAR